MKNIENAKWIKHPMVFVDRVIEFSKNFAASGAVASATLEITSLGVYEAKINGKRVGDFIFAPGWTSYNKRLQVETYADALERIYEQPVKARYLYLFHLDRFVSI